MRTAGSVATTATALPHQMTEREIMYEYQRDEQRILDEADGQAADGECMSTSGASSDRERISPEQMAKMPLHELFARLRDADRCGECGKTRAVMNVARRGFTPERVTPETHCACVGGPAYAGVGGAR